MLVPLMPSEVLMLMGEMIHVVKTDSLKVSDIILIMPGEKVAADGIISEGESYMYESMHTVESVPIKKQKGERVIAGSINGNGSFRVIELHILQ